MPVPWFTVEGEKAEIGTEIFKADDYYERLQHITGMWSDNKFLHYEVAQSPEESSEEDPEHPKPMDPSKIFTISDIKSVPQLLAYLDRANLKGVLSTELLDFMWELHKLYIKKMSDFGYATKWMSKKEFSLLENREKWTKLLFAMESLRYANDKEEKKVKRRKRMLKPTKLTVYNRLEDLPDLKVNRDGSLVPLKPWEKKQMQKQKEELNAQSKRKSRRKAWLGVGGGKKSGLSEKLAQMFQNLRSREYFKKLKTLTKPNQNPFSEGRKPPGPYAWDYGKTRLFTRTNIRIVGKHFEFTKLYHKLSKALRFTKSEPVDWRTITLEEVDKHRFQNDCWMVIKGRVYDVTDFLKVHPGGSEIIMQGAGTDATAIFVSVHPYVVFYQHLKGKQIGTLPDYEEHPHTEWEPSQNFCIYTFLKEWYYRPKHPLEQWRAKTHFDQTDTEYIYTITFPSNLVSREEDWTISIIDGFKVTVIKHVETPYVWYGGFDLRTKIMDDTAYRKFSPDYNSVEVKIAKSYKVRVKHPVRDWRQDDGFFLSSYSLRDMYRVSVVDRRHVVDGVKLYGLSMGMNKYLGCPIGCYVNLRILDETRPYTPVCLPDEFEEKFQDESGEFQTLFFIIKEFKDGDFTSMLHRLPTKKILLGVNIFISPPMGNFKVDFLFNEVDVMLLIAGGTGISVMTRIIQEYIQRKSEMKGKVVCLILFAQYREDLIWNKVWLDLSKKYEWLKYFFSLSRVFRYATAREKRATLQGNKAKGVKEHRKKGKPIVLESDTANPHELYGYPSTTKMEHVFEHLPPGSDNPEKKQKAIVCGPYGFNHSCRLMLKQFGKHTEDNIHFFAG